MAACQLAGLNLLDGCHDQMTHDGEDPAGREGKGGDALFDQNSVPISDADGAGDVGIDYSLFIVTRFRQALHDGMSPEDAAATAGDTAGRAVVFAGVTVAISISGLVVIGLDFVTKLGFGAAITVLTTAGGG